MKMEESSQKVKKKPLKRVGHSIVFNFRADEEILIAIDRIAASLPAWVGKGGGRSAAIRKVVLEYVERLDQLEKTG